MSKDNKMDFPEEYRQVRETILKNLKQKKFQDAYINIREILDYPGYFYLENVWEDVLILFEKLLREMIGDEWGDYVKKVIDNPKDVDSLYDLAYNLYEEGAHSIAATFLMNANKIKPQDEKIVAELVVNLELMMLNEEVCTILSNSKKLLELSELCQYLLGFNSMMIGDIARAQEILPLIQKSKDEDILSMADSMEGMINRALVLKKSRSLDNTNLRGWHMVLNGAILMHISPYGIEEGMNGRYAYISDSYSLCREGIDRLKLVLETAAINIPYILSLPDRSSQILALATSEILKKPLKFWDEIDINTKGLIVAYDLNEIYSDELIIEIADHRPDQILWSHASCWTYPFPFAPDITTYLYQENHSPWGGGQIVYNKKEQRTEIAETDKSEIEDLSIKIVNAEKDKEYLDDLDDLIAIIQPLKSLEGNSKPGIFRTEGKRLHERIGSPVPSNKFM